MLTPGSMAMMGCKPRTAHETGIMASLRCCLPGSQSHTHQLAGAALLGSGHGCCSSSSLNSGSSRQQSLKCSRESELFRGYMLHSTRGLTSLAAGAGQQAGRALLIHGVVHAVHVCRVALAAAGGPVG